MSSNSSNVNLHAVSEVDVPAVLAVPEVTAAAEVAVPIVESSVTRSTKPCVFFLQNKCNKGDNCRYKHTQVAAAEVTQVAVAAAVEEPTGNKTTYCFNVISNRVCTNKKCDKKVHNRRFVWDAVRTNPTLMELFSRFSNGKPFPSIAPSADESGLPVVVHVVVPAVGAGGAAAAGAGGAAAAGAGGVAAGAAAAGVGAGGGGGGGAGHKLPCLHLIAHDKCTSSNCKFNHDKQAALDSLNTPDGLERFNKFKNVVKKVEPEKFCFAEMAGQNEGTGKCRINGCKCEHTPEARVRFLEACLLYPGLLNAFNHYKASKK